MILHKLIVIKSGRNVALVLKRIIGVWLISRFDNSREVSKLSKESFKLSFGDKETEVLKFCLDDILIFLTRMILVESVESLSDERHFKAESDNRFTSPDEMLSKHSRMISSCFDVIHLLIGI